MEEVDEQSKEMDKVIVEVSDLSFDEVFKGRHSVMNKYLRSWERWRHS